MNEKREMLRHFLGALAYRTQKALRGAPDDFAEFDAGGGVRTPMELVRHMASVFGLCRGHFLPAARYRPEPLPTFNDEIERFHQMLADLREIARRRHAAHRHDRRANAARAFLGRDDARRPARNAPPPARRASAVREFYFG